MMRNILSLFVLLLLSSTAQSEQLIMARVGQSFPETMLALQDAIGGHGYKVTRVQRVDIGLTSSGYHTDKYRVVFFAKPQELRDMVEQFPQLLAYLPLKINIFAENSETLINTIDPTELGVLANSDVLHQQLQRWKNDILSIIDDVSKTGN
jgi:uncharacterized protein (DUF302 family)